MSRLRPFPFPVSVGTDIIRISRIKDILLGRKSVENASKFIARLLTSRERHHFQQRFPEVISTGTHDSKITLVAQHLAGRFAAKEAVMKACTWRRLYFHDIQILQRSQTPAIYGVILDQSVATPEAQQSMETDAENVESASGQVVQVSISHDTDYATAVCIAAIEPEAGDVGGQNAARSP